MTIYEDLERRGLIAQMTHEEKIKEIFFEDTVLDIQSRDQ